MSSRTTAMVVALTVLATAAFAACSSQPEKAVTDRQQLIRVALEWALVDKNLPDFGLLPDPTNVLISLDGEAGGGPSISLAAHELPTLPGVTLTALTEGELRKKADITPQGVPSRVCRKLHAVLPRVELSSRASAD